MLTDNYHKYLISVGIVIAENYFSKIIEISHEVLVSEDLVKVDQETLRTVDLVLARLHSFLEETILVSGLEVVDKLDDDLLRSSYKTLLKLITSGEIRFTDSVLWKIVGEIAKDAKESN